MTTQRSTLSLLSLVAMLTFLASSSSVHAWAPTTSFTSTAFATRHQSLSEPRTTTQLSAWSLPAPMQKGGGSYWYQDCGTAVQRHVVYNDEDDWQFQEDATFGLGFARLSLLEDDALVSSFSQDANEEAPATERFPIRMIRGVWNRICRSIQ